jgi:hypothetical protein
MGESAWCAGECVALDILARTSCIAWCAVPLHRDPVFMSIILAVLIGALIGLAVIAAIAGYYLLVIAAIYVRARIVSRPRGNSPLPAERYDDSRRERWLWNPVRVPLDSALADLARRYAGSDAAGRARMRKSLDVVDFDELITFANRAAVFALRERSTEHVRDGLAAVAMIDMARSHPMDTDFTVPVALLHHVATRIGADAAALLREAAALAEESVARFLTSFPDFPAEKKDLLKFRGLEEVQTPGGPGFIPQGSRDSQPTLDLLSAGLEVADVLERDEYQPRGVMLGSDLPTMWLRTGGSADPGAVSLALHTARAHATISASLRPEVLPGHRAQSLHVFLVELANEQDARTLHDASRQVRHPKAALLGMAEGRLFCVLVAEPAFSFVGLYETTERLSRFHAPLRAILGRYAAGEEAGATRS